MPGDGAPPARAWAVTMKPAASAGKALVVVKDIIDTEIAPDAKGCVYRASLINELVAIAHGLFLWRIIRSQNNIHRYRQSN
jgi:hypothetical protein